MATDDWFEPSSPGARPDRESNPRRRERPSSSAALVASALDLSRSLVGRALTTAGAATRRASDSWSATGAGGSGDGGDGGGGDGRGGPAGSPDSSRPRVYKLRLALILAGLGGLAIVSTVFGMMMAVASDLPALENRQEYRNARNSILLDDQGRQIGVLTSRNNRILVQPDQVSPAMQHAIIAIEDQRFYQNNGVDIRGIGRALFADLARKRAVQGASTITQQFVKNALAAQHQRTLFQKLREAALAYHLNRKWSKQKILTEYLNAVYFGNGAYGIESAARTYYGKAHQTVDAYGDSAPGCGVPGKLPCAALLTPAEAATIAGVVASPSAFDPIAHPQASRRRRDVVLARMLSQGYITREDYRDGKQAPIPATDTITYPHEDSQAPYFTTWVKQQVIERYGAQRALNGGLKVHTTLDLDLQQAAVQAVSNHLSSPDGPAAALVAIDNRTGEVRAMVGGRPGALDDYDHYPFNLATDGQRQPGSSFKVFTLAQALREGISPDSTWTSQKKVFDVPNSGGKEKFVVNNYEGDYAGVSSLADATTRSDNSVYAEVGLKVGTKNIAAMAHSMGIRTPISTNPAITLGGLKEGVTPLDMAHAYETLAAGGQRVTGTLAAGVDGTRGADTAGPVGVDSVTFPDQHGRTVHNQPIRLKVVSKKLAETETEILKSVVCCGTGKAAATGGFAAGKTGTTENYGDAWFVGFNKRWTVAVWVGYPDRLKSMETDYNGGPVAGGTYPAEIWHDFVVSANQIQNQRLAEEAARQGKGYTPPDQSSDSGSGSTGVDSSGSGSGDSSGAGSSTPDSGASQPSQSSGTSSSSGSGGGGGGGGGGGASSGGGGDSGGGGGGGGGGGPSPTPAPSGGGSGGATGAPGGTAPG